MTLPSCISDGMAPASAAANLLSGLPAARLHNASAATFCIPWLPLPNSRTSAGMAPAAAIAGLVPALPGDGNW